MHMRTIAFCTFMTMAATTIMAQEYSFTPDISIPSETEEFGVGAGAAAGLKLALSGEAQTISREFFDFSFASKYFGFVTAFTFHQDDDFPPEPAAFPDGTLLDSYFTMDQGGMVLHGLDMELQVGRLEHHDAIDSPYTLFVSSKRLPAMIANFRYENDFAFFETRWIRLNEKSSVSTPAFPNGFPDRGASLKTYGIKLGTMRIGFEDAAIYTKRSFDLEYFVSPMPNYLIQSVRGATSRPWIINSNDNSLMGFFWDWKPSEAWYLDAQFIMDDMNMGGLGGTPLAPWKAAYSLGGSWTTDIGKFSLHHALATKYCYGTTADSDVNLVYPWAYYPDTRYNVGSGYQSISIEDMMIGYYNGENNMAFRLDYDAEWLGIALTSNLELVLSGPKSPANAWHEGSYIPGTKFLDYSLIEKKVVLTAQASRHFGDFIVFLDARAGVAINAMELQEPYAGAEAEANNDINAKAWIWRPGDATEYILSVGLGLRYEVPVMKALRK